MNRSPSSHPSPPVGEKVPGGRLRGIPIGSWLRFTSEFWRCPLPMNGPDPAKPLRTVGGVVLLRDDNAALLQLRDNKPGLNAAGLWVFPGGHCEPDESLEAGA